MHKSEEALQLALLVLGVILRMQSEYHQYLKTSNSDQKRRTHEAELERLNIILQQSQQELECSSLKLHGGQQCFFDMRISRLIEIPEDTTEAYKRCVRT